jgi:hypothetical protein
LKLRRSTLLVASSSAAVGILFLLAMLIIYFRFNTFLDAVANHDQARTTVYQLVTALKAVAFLLCPALCVIIITAGFCAIRYIRASCPSVGNTAGGSASEAFETKPPARKAT